MAKIERLHSGNYRLRVTVGYTEDGRQIRKSFTHYDKDVLRAMAADYVVKHRNAVQPVRVGDAIDTFLDAKLAVLSPSTVRAYTSLAKTVKTRYAAFCASYVDAVTPRDVQSLVNGLVADGKTPKTVRNVHGFLSAVFKFAGGTLPACDLPQRVRPEIHIPDEPTVHDIKTAAAGTDLEPAVRLALYGLRRSEICAIRPDDLDGNVLHIHAAVVYGADRVAHLKTTKTYSSDRYITIDDGLAGLIRRGPVGYTPAALTHAFDRLLAKNGLPHYRLHDLRHFFVSYCHNVLGLSDAQIQAMTGHATSVVLRSIYLHPMNVNTVQAAVASAVAGL